jgi:hypothetical protein
VKSAESGQCRVCVVFSDAGPCGTTPLPTAP